MGKQRIAASAVGLALLIATTDAADWPRWRGPTNDGHVPAGTIMPPALPTALEPAWRVPVGHGLASPVVAAGRVFHLDNQNERETVHALDAATGAEFWRLDLDATFKDGHSEAGPRCTPVVDGDRVYVQSCRGEFQCLAVADGRTRWRVNFEQDFGVVFIGEKGSAPGATRHGNSGAPLVHGGNIFVAVGSTNGASVVCFDKLSGRLKWKSQNDIAGYAPLVMGSPGGKLQLIVFTAEGAIGLSPAEGTLLWRVPIKTSFGRHVAAPIVVDDLVIVSSHQAGLMGIRVAKAGEGWTAEQAWLNKAATINYASPVVVGSHLYGLGRSQRLVCVDAHSGERKWSEQSFTSKRVVKDLVSMLVMGDNILMLVDNGELVMFTADPAAYREIGRGRACSRTWCLPAYSDGRLYLRDEKELVCLPLIP